MITKKQKIAVKQKMLTFKKQTIAKKQKKIL